MKLNDQSKSSKGYTIYWDKVFLALAIFSVAIICAVSIVRFLASGSDDTGTKTVDKQILGSTFANNPPEEIPEEDVYESSSAVRPLKVVIDPGHGGEDGGSTNFSETRIEKDDDLQFALAVKSQLEKMGVEVVMTRETDVYVSLDDRCDIANQSKADLFVSLHRNSSQNGSGVEIWVSKKKPKADTKLAQNIMNALEEVGITENRGVQFGYIDNPGYDYQVNMDTEMPSCLVELGFISNDKDNTLFDEKFSEYAKAVAEAIVKTGQDLKIN